MTDKEALEICYNRMQQNDYVADQAYCNGNKGLCKIKENENLWLYRIYVLASRAYYIGETDDENI